MDTQERSNLPISVLVPSSGGFQSPMNPRCRNHRAVRGPAVPNFAGQRLEGTSSGKDAATRHVPRPQRSAVFRAVEGRRVEEIIDTDDLTSETTARSRTGVASAFLGTATSAEEALRRFRQRRSVMPSSAKTCRNPGRQRPKNPSRFARSRRPKVVSPSSTGGDARGCPTG
jgi:hypothetical protein